MSGQRCGRGSLWPVCAPEMQHGSFQGGGMCNKTTSCLEKSLFYAVVSCGSVRLDSRTYGAILLFLSLF